MLEIRPNCELCDKELPPNSAEARICSYECTFCARCVKSVLENVCPNCGGGFEKRPIRPATARRIGISLVHQAASIARIHSEYAREQIVDFSNAIKKIKPENR